MLCYIFGDANASFKPSVQYEKFRNENKERVREKKSERMGQRQRLNGSHDLKIKQQ